MKKNRMNSFSVALGLFDYLNPIFYSITSITIIINLFNDMPLNIRIIYIIGLLFSIIFGFTIPTVKLLVGLGKFEFNMPVNLVFYVNSGLLISGLSLFTYVFNVNIALYYSLLAIIVCFLVYIRIKTIKFNTIAVLTGAVGYILLYSSLIYYSSLAHNILSIILIIIAIILFVTLCLMGIFSNLKNPKVHWAIEIENACCQLFVALSTILLFL